jgi:hypothetical protein
MFSGFQNLFSGGENRLKMTCFQAIFRLFSGPVFRYHKPENSHFGTDPRRFSGDFQVQNTFIYLNNLHV